MKIHYINALLFALPLNILAHNKNKPYTTLHTQTNRSLCECELYESANYDNDQEMKRVMQQFEDRASQRLREYDDRMVEKRKRCKDKCDKDIQKIILKDILEKQMVEQLTTLETKINTDDIPTCICEKSLVDKMEKGCLRCGGVLGGGVMPAFGTIGGTALYALNQLKPYALFTAAKYAIFKGAAEGAVAGKAAGMNVINVVLKQKGIATYCTEIFDSIQKIKSFTELNSFADLIIKKHAGFCAISTTKNAAKEAMCVDFGRQLGTHLKNGDPLGPPAGDLVPQLLKFLSGKAKTTANAEAAKVTSTTYTKIMTKQTSLIEGGFNSTITSIYAAIIAIVVIVLIMVIIYLILRYRRKKKMKKKLQYIKLLEE